MAPPHAHCPRPWIGRERRHTVKQMWTIDMLELVPASTENQLKDRLPAIVCHRKHSWADQTFQVTNLGQCLVRAAKARCGLADEHEVDQFLAWLQRNFQLLSSLKHESTLLLCCARQSAWLQCPKRPIKGVLGSSMSLAIQL